MKLRTSLSLDEAFEAARNSLLLEGATIVEEKHPKIIVAELSYYFTKVRCVFELVDIGNKTLIKLVKAKFDLTTNILVLTLCIIGLFCITYGIGNLWDLCFHEKFIKAHMGSDYFNYLVAKAWIIVVLGITILVLNTGVLYYSKFKIIKEVFRKLQQALELK